MSNKSKFKKPPLDKHGDPCPRLDYWLMRLEEVYLDCQVGDGNCDKCWLRVPCSLLWKEISDVSSRRLLRVIDYNLYLRKFKQLRSNETEDSLDGGDKQ